jgi:DNA-binding SARP family transcriptional activator
MPEFRVLGPVVVAADGESRALPGKERALLAALLLQPGRIVSTDGLIEALWGTEPPASARKTVQWHVKQLRRTLGPQIAERIITRAPGYLIEVRPGELDLDNFSGLADRGRSAARAGDWERAADLLAAALAQWCGDPLSDVPSAALRRSEVPRLTELRAQVQEARIEADLHVGRHQEVTAELRQLVATQPYRERTCAQLMLALYRSGRRGEALDAYQRARSGLRDELGIEPGSELQRLYQRILAADPALTEDMAGTPPGRAPRQLPADLPDFAGRTQEIDALSTALGASGPSHLGAVATCVLTGPGGIGKTTLAIHVAHLIAERFPDGQLFVSLGGAGAAAPASDVLARFLRDLGVPDAVIPAGEAERAARYRSLLAGRKVLVVLDDARDAGQVWPLLPGAEGSAVIVTSRGMLAGLASISPTRLAPLDKEASRTLLAAMTGEQRAAADPEGTDGVLTACGGLPLALRIAGSRLAARPEWTIGWLSALLASDQRRLAELAAGDLAVQASLEVSYRALSDLGAPEAEGPPGRFRDG